MAHIMPAEKQRRRGEAAARQPATPAKRRKVARVAATRTNCSCTARPDVRTYLERYRSGGEKQVMASLRSLAAGELETELESCERLPAAESGPVPGAGGMGQAPSHEIMRDTGPIIGTPPDEAEPPPLGSTAASGACSSSCSVTTNRCNITCSTIDILCINIWTC